MSQKEDEINAYQDCRLYPREDIIKIKSERQEEVRGKRRRRKRRDRRKERKGERGREK